MITVRKVEGRRRKLRIAYINQVKEKVKMTSHRKVKELAMDCGKWKWLHQYEGSS